VEIISGILPDGSAGPSLLVCFGSRRMVVNCPEGWQRMCSENKLRISRVDIMLITSARPSSLLGLPGAMITLADMPEHSTTADPSFSLEILGPEGSANFVHAQRYVYKRPQSHLVVREIGAEGLQRTFEDGLELKCFPLRKRQDAPLLKRRRISAKGKDFAVPPNFGKFEVHLPEGDEAESCLCFLFLSPPKRGKFLPEKARELGLQPGPDFGRLTRGENVTTANGTIVSPEQCMEDAGEGRQGILVVDCFSEAFIPSLPKVFEEIRFVVHLGPLDVLRSDSYQAWCNKFGGAQHVLLGKGSCVEKIVFRSSAEIQAMLHNEVSSDHFHLDASLAEEEGLSIALDDFIEGAVRGESGMKLIVHPKSARGVHVCDKEVTVSHSFTGNKVRELSAPCFYFLGTGASIPSKYRNVSSILVQFSGGSALLDAGEGTVAQICRIFGHEKGFDLICNNLKFVWISHMHADHLLGVLHILSIPRRDELVVIGPEALELFLKDCFTGLDLIERPKYLFETINREKAAEEGGHTHSNVPESLGLCKLTSFRVLHRFDSFGVLLELNDEARHKVVYSGDSEPCKAMVRASKNAHLLIHEATFENEKLEQAKAKRHSTIGQAIEIGKEAAVKFLVLTHFSQRYPKYQPEVLEKQDGMEIVVASDMMSFNFETIHSAAQINEKVQQLFNPEGSL